MLGMKEPSTPGIDRGDLLSPKERKAEIVRRLGPELLQLHNFRTRSIDGYATRVQTNQPDAGSYLTDLACLSVLQATPNSKRKLREAVDATLADPIISEGSPLRILLRSSSTNDKASTKQVLEETKRDALEYFDTKPSRSDPQLETMINKYEAVFVAQAYLGVISDEPSDWATARKELVERYDIAKDATYADVRVSIADWMIEAGQLEQAKLLTDSMGIEEIDLLQKAHIQRALAVAYAKAGRVDDARATYRRMPTVYGLETRQGPMFFGPSLQFGENDVPLGQEFQAGTIAQVAAVTNDEIDWIAAENAFDNIENKFTTNDFFAIFDKNGTLSEDERLNRTLDYIKGFLSGLNEEEFPTENLAELRGGQTVEEYRDALIEITTILQENTGSVASAGPLLNAYNWLHFAAFTKNATDIESAAAAVKTYKQDEWGSYNEVEINWMDFELATLIADFEQKHPEEQLAIDVNERLDDIRKTICRYDTPNLTYQPELQLRLALLFRERGQHQKAQETAASIEPEEYFDIKNPSPETVIPLLRILFDELASHGTQSDRGETFVELIKYLCQQIPSEDLQRLNPSSLVRIATSLEPITRYMEEFEAREEL